jgi:hypothetical protein
MARRWVLLLVLATAILAACDPATPPAIRPSPSMHAGAGVAQGGSPLACPYPSVRPTYLPWVEPGEDIPEPDAHSAPGDDGISYAFLDWTDPHDAMGHFHYKVTLVRTGQYNLGAPGTPVDVSIEGSDPGELYDGKQPGEASIYWVIPNVTACSTVAIWFSSQDMTRKQAREEIKRIARSLRPAG